MNPRDLAARARQRCAAGPASTPTTTSTTAKPKGDRWATLNAVVDVVLRELGEAELRVWLVLFRDVRGGVARVGMSDIARRAGLTRRGVVKAIDGLKRRRLVARTARGTVGGLPNTYRLESPT